MSIGIIIFVILSLIFFGRAMANQDAGHHLWNVVVDVGPDARINAGATYTTGESYV